MISKAVICGVGLIGGSFALSLKAAAAVDQVVGLGRTTGTLQDALRLGAIDSIALDWSDALHGADLVLLAMPVGQMAAAFTAMAPLLSEKTVVTDAGSTKVDVISLARQALGDKIGQFVPGHPIAGAETSGVAAATSGLYRNKRVVLTPLPENTHESIERVGRAWAACGAKVSELSSGDHDRVFAAVSHLPHVLAFSLVSNLAGRTNSEQLFSFAGGGFRDFTRIASSHPEMWRDICVSNRNALLDELDAYMAELLRTRVLLASANADGLESMFGAARDRREIWLETLSFPGE